MKLRQTMMGCLVIAASAFAACDKEDDPMVSETDQNFMIQVSQSNLAEVDLGQVAATRGAADSVKIFGNMMVMDHTMAQHRLDSLANLRKVDLPDAPDAAHQTLKQTLATLSGRQFDTTYMSSQVMDHQMTIALLQSIINNAGDAGLKAYATESLPKVQMHLTMAQRLRAKL
jgi:putative membrane protein